MTTISTFSFYAGEAIFFTRPKPQYLIERHTGVVSYKFGILTSLDEVEIQITFIIQNLTKIIKKKTNTESNHWCDCEDPYDNFRNIRNDPMYDIFYQTLPSDQSLKNLIFCKINPWHLWLLKSVSSEMFPITLYTYKISSKSVKIYSSYLKGQELYWLTFCRLIRQSKKSMPVI